MDHHGSSESCEEITVGATPLRLDSQPFPQPANPWDFWSWVFIIGGTCFIVGTLFLLRELQWFVPAEDNQITVLLLVVLFTGAIFLGVRIFNKLSIYRFDLSEEKKTIFHGWTGYMCKHDVTDVFGLLLLGDPFSIENTSEKGTIILSNKGYQLVLILHNPQKSRCLLLWDADYLRLKTVGQAFAEEIRVPFLDKVKKSNE